MYQLLYYFNVASRCHSESDICAVSWSLKASHLVEMCSRPKSDWEWFMRLLRPLLLKLMNPTLMLQLTWLSWEESGIQKTETVLTSKYFSLILRIISEHNFDTENFLNHLNCCIIEDSGQRHVYWFKLAGRSKFPDWNRLIVDII